MRSLRCWKLRFHSLVLLSPFAFLSCTFEVNTRIRLVEGSSPPSFKLYGTGEQAGFWVYGPRSTCNELETFRLGVETPLWRAASKSSNDDRTVFNLSTLTYGELPAGYKQEVPAGEPVAPALQDGKYYLLWVSVNGASNNALKFQVKGGKASPCQ
jgi:hypothetical protein